MKPDLKKEYLNWKLREFLKSAVVFAILAICLFLLIQPQEANATDVTIDGKVKHVDLQPSLVVGQSNTGTNYLPVKTTTDGGIVINQNTVVDPANSSVINLAAGATYVGAWVPDLNYTAVQYSLRADQNCLIYIEQSSNGGVSTVISDPFAFYTSKGNSSNTVQLTGTDYRIRVTNVGKAATTYFELQAIKVPFLQSLPRSLDFNGNLRTSVYGIVDPTGFVNRSTPHGELLVSPIYRLVGSSFAHASLDPNFWTATLGTGGSAVTATGELVLSTGTTANNATSVKTISSARHVAGTANKFHSSFRFPDSGLTANNTRIWGALDLTLANGAFFQIINGAFSIVTRNGGVDTVVPNGSFNGELGITVTESADNTEFDILYLVDGVWFYINGQLLHHVSALSGAWAADMSLYTYISNTNTGGSTTNVTIICRHAVISRLGSPTTQPKDNFLQRVGIDISATLKLGAGNLHGVVLSGITNNAVVTIYDNTTATGTIKWTSGTLTANGLPFEIDLKDIPFSVGLTVSITGANLNVLTMYE